MKFQPDRNRTLYVVLAANGFLFVIIFLFFDIGSVPQQVPKTANLSQDAWADALKGYAVPEDWQRSDAWEDYLSQLKTTDQFFYQKKSQPIINDDYYCEKRLEFVNNRRMEYDEDGLPTKENKNFYIEFPWNTAMQNAAKKIGTVYSVQDQIDRRNDVNPIRLPVEADVFWAYWTDFYWEHEIGKHYLCHGQRASYIPGAKKMKMKDDLALMMKAYAKNFEGGREHCFQYEEYMPKTYVMIDEEDCYEALSVLEKEIGNQTKIKWLGKIARDSHKGLGITIMTEDAIQDLLEEYDYGRNCKAKSTNLKESYLIQSFIQNPYLVKGRKFDFRVFLTIASLDPFIVLYHDGFVKIAYEEWDEDSADWNALIASLSATQEAQKDSGLSNSEVLAEVKWTLQQFEDHLVEEGKVEKGWVKKVLRVEMRKAMLHLMRMTSQDFLMHPDLFGYFGVDFLLDDDLHMWFLEIVDQPGLLSKTPEMTKVTDETFSNLLNMQIALSQDDWEVFDEIVEDSDFEWVIDSRLSGYDKYAGLIQEEECLQVWAWNLE